MMSNPDFVNTLYYGDNLTVMRKFIKDESVDLIYLDPAFNSKADYNVLFKETSGEGSTAQIQILTIEQLLKGVKQSRPPTSSMFKEAPEIKHEKEMVQKKL